MKEKIATQKESQTSKPLGKRNPKFTKSYMEMKREMAKIGMTTTLLLTSGSALFVKNRVAKAVHIGAGVALVGFVFGTLHFIPKNIIRQIKISIMLAYSKQSSKENFVFRFHY